jgi:MoaA/NifB/PqqE/SkfB family radical SAM enzyme
MNFKMLVNLKKTITSPDTLYLFTTRECNLNCPYCSTTSNERKTGPLLNLPEKKALLNQSRRMGIRKLVICGAGEPLLDRDIFSLIRHSNSLRIQTTVITNGTLITRDVARRLLKNRVRIRFKLESLNKERSDMMCGREDSYEWVPYTYNSGSGFRDVEIPSGLGFILEYYSSPLRRRMIKLESVITRINMGDIAGIAAFCRDNGIGYSPKELRVAGRAAENYPSLVLNRQELLQVFGELRRIMGGYFAKFLTQDCCDMRYNPFVAEDGECITCLSVYKSSGNIRNSSLGSLFRKSLTFKRTMDCNIKHFKKIIG